MKTFPNIRDDGSVIGFEINNTFIAIGTVKAILNSINDVADVKRKYFSDDRVLFKFNGVQCTVNEPYGDNSRYWIGPINVVETPIDIAPVHLAFSTHEGLIYRLRRFVLKSSV